MARVKLGIIVSDIRGSIGGVTFSQTKGGLIAKGKPITIGAKSTLQQNSMLKCANVGSAYSQLSTANKNLWNSLANTFNQSMKNAKDKFLNGNQLYQKYQLLRTNSGFSLLTSPVFATIKLPPIVPVFNQMATNFYIYWGANIFTYGLYGTIKLSQPIGSSTPFNASKLKCINTSYQSTDFVNLYNTYFNLFGIAPAVGMRMMFSITMIGSSCPRIFAPLTGIATLVAP